MDTTSSSSLPPVAEFLDEDRSSGFALEANPPRRTTSMPLPEINDMAEEETTSSSTFGRFTQQFKNRRSLNTPSGRLSGGLDTGSDHGPKAFPSRNRRTSGSPSVGRSSLGSVNEDRSFRGSVNEEMSNSYHGTRDSMHKRGYNRSSGGPHRSSSGGASRSPTRGIRRSTSLESPAGRLSAMILPSSLGAKVSRRSQTVRSSLAAKFTNFGGTSQNMDDEEYEGERHELYNRENLYRGYSVGDAVLVFSNNRFSSCVNRFGFPPGAGRTPEEKTGPYLFVLGKVQQIHFEENSVFYTVRREDTDVDVRGTPGKFFFACMSPVGI